MLEPGQNDAPATEDEGQTDQLIRHQEMLIVRDHGPLLMGRSLMQTLGYPSLEALRQAIHRGTVPVPVFPVENRRGKAALATDIARWYVQRRRLAAPVKQSETI